MKALAHRLIVLANSIIDMAQKINYETLNLSSLDTKEKAERFIHAMETIDDTVHMVGGQIRLLAIERYQDIIRREVQDAGATICSTPTADSSHTD